MNSVVKFDETSMRLLKQRHAKTHFAHCQQVEKFQPKGLKLSNAEPFQSTQQINPPASLQYYSHKQF